jgi:hypothetical protein
VRTAIALGLVFAMLSCTGSNEPVAKTPTSSETTSTSTATTQPSSKSSAQPVTIETALDAIGANCDKPLSAETDCTWKGVIFTVEISADW